MHAVVITLTRTTPLLSTISWIVRPFLPITLPTKFLGTWMDSSLYSSIERAFRTASSVSPNILKVHVCSSSSICVTPSNFLAVCIFIPWAPIANPIRSSRTRNSSEKLENQIIFLTNCRQSFLEMHRIWNMRIVWTNIIWKFFYFIFPLTLALILCAIFCIIVNFESKQNSSFFRHVLSNSKSNNKCLSDICVFMCLCVCFGICEKKTKILENELSKIT